MMNERYRRIRARHLQLLSSHLHPLGTEIDDALDGVFADLGGAGERTSGLHHAGLEPASAQTAWSTRPLCKRCNRRIFPRPSYSFYRSDLDHHHGWDCAVTRAEREARLAAHAGDLAAAAERQREHLRDMERRNAVLAVLGPYSWWIRVRMETADGQRFGRLGIGADVQLVSLEAVWDAAMAHPERAVVELPDGDMVSFAVWLRGRVPSAIERARVAPGTTTITLPNGLVVALADWIDDKVWPSLPIGD